MKNLFLDISFPKSFCNFYKHSVEFFTNLQIAKNGSESRLILSDFGRSKFILEEAIFPESKVNEIWAFYCLVKGRGHSFRFLDEKDNQAENQDLLTTEDGIFLSKTYLICGLPFVRKITKPIKNELKITTQNGILEESKDYEANYQTGEILLKSNIFSLKASFKFEIEVRFESDELVITRDKFGNFIIKNLILTEVL
jgi:uncharacterized protein (TIGR02217 family)